MKLCIVVVLGLILLTSVEVLQAQSVVAHVQGNSGASGAAGSRTVSVTLVNPVAAGDFIVCGLSGAEPTNTSLTSIKDQAGNSYAVSPHSPTAYLSGAGMGWGAYNLAPPAGNTTVTGTLAAASAHATQYILHCDEFSAVGGTATFDKDAVNSNAGPGTAMNLPSISPSVSGSLLYALGNPRWNITGCGSPWVCGGNGIQPSTGFGLGGTAAEYIKSASGTIPIGFTQNQSGTWSAVVMSFTITAKGAAPTIVTQPALNTTVSAGQTATFSVVAAGSSPLSYQWSRNGAAISGATSSSYTTPATTTADSGSTFKVQVTNAFGNITSTTATLTVNAVGQAPTITSQPAPQTVIVGQTATFSVIASGTSPLLYQWRRNGTVISGATGATYTTPATTAGDNGSGFSVVVSNSFGSATSSAALLSVNTGGYSGRPYLGSPVSLPGVVEAANYDLGGQGVAYNVLNTVNQGGAYRTTEAVSLEKTGDSTTSAPGDAYDMGWINPTEWENYAVTSAGGPFTASIRVAANGAGGTFHLECPTGTKITGELTIPNTGGWQTYTTLTAPVTLPTGNQVLRVVWDTAPSGFVGNLHWIQIGSTSNVGQAPTITSQPAPQTVTVGQTATFSVIASGTSPLLYQWRKNGTVISGATGASYTTPVTTAGDNGSGFSVVVSNSFGSATSSAALLSVNTGGYSGRPYLGSPVSLPGVVEAANYDLGGQGVAYNVLNTVNQGGAYRTAEAVSLEQTGDSKTSASGDAYDMGWINPTEWENYTVTSAGGTFTASIRVAANGAGGTFHLECPTGTKITGELTIPNTGGWQTYTTLTAPVTLPSGNQVLRVVWDTAPSGFVGNFHWIQITSSSGGTDTAWVVSPATDSISGPYPMTIQYHAVGNVTGRDMTGSVTWTSSNPPLVSIGAGGLAMVVDPGSAGNTSVTITATK